ncbi:MAG: fimbrial protein [Fermentimonas sp.]|nr:fimbrial protein [Fermentimonas sp.]
MKIFKVLLVVAIAFGMMACNNEQDVPEISGEKDASISIKVYPSSDSPSFRATGDLSSPATDDAVLAAESAIKTLEVWVFTGDALEAYKSATIADGAVPEVLDIEVTSGPRTIVVVANANLNSQPTLTALKALTKNLTQDLSTGLVMTAEPIVNVPLVKGNNYYGYTGITSTGETYHNQTPVALTRVNARVAIVDADIELKVLTEGEVHVFDNLKDVQVAMFNVPKVTNLFGASLATNANYLFGNGWPSPLGTYTVGTAEPKLLDETITFPIVNTAAPYYYVNENTAEAAKEQMFIVLRGRPYMGENQVTQYQGLYTDEGGYTYYPVWVNANKTGYGYATGHSADSKIVRNTQYNISLTITGIGNPTIDEPETAWLDVKVEVSPWLVVNQSVEW